MAKNALYFGDNLEVLYRYLADESVDLIYLDPPFQSGQDYNVLFAEQNGTRSAAQIAAFEDTWHWDQRAAESYQEVVEAGGKVSQLMQAFRGFLGDNDMLAYLSMMAPRLKELRRVLKPTGSIYLHCDPTAGHYLRLLMDAVFGAEHFRNEIVWKRTYAHSSANRYGPVHDYLLFYTKTDRYCWNKCYTPHDQDYVRRNYTHVDADGRRWMADNLTAAGMRRGSSGQPWRGFSVTERGRHRKFSIENLERLDAEDRIYWPPGGGWPRHKQYLDEVPGVLLQDVWTDIPPISSRAKERLGYQMQKPLRLLERIIEASSNPGDVVLDPFCGCGTTVVAAEKLNRRWIGIDITHLAIGLVRHRLETTFGSGASYRVIGEPTSVADAEALARESPYQFQYWALGLVGARPEEERRGRDRGIDGLLYFHDDETRETKCVVLQVKSGRVSVSHVRDLRGVIEREQADIGVFMSLEEPTRAMKTEAAGAGYYYSRGWRKRYPRLQILTIRELLAGKRIDYPPSRRNVTYKAAPREKKGGYYVREPDLSEVETSFAAADGPEEEFELADE